MRKTILIKFAKALLQDLEIYIYIYTVLEVQLQLMLHESFSNVDILVHNFHKEITLVFDGIFSFSSKYKNIIQI